MQTELYEKNVNILGEKIKIVEWAEKFFSIQVEQKTYANLIKKIKPSEDLIENFLYEEKEKFLQDNNAKIMELIIGTNTKLYREIMNEKEKKISN